MKVPWLLLPVLSALVGAVDVQRRQNDDESSTSEAPASTTSDSSSDDGGDTTSEPPVSTTSESDEDTTVVVTATVTGEAETITTRTYKVTTVTSTRTNTVTELETTTTTERNQPTATSTIWETTTTIINAKRDVGLDIFTVEGEWIEVTATAPAEAIAMVTSEPLNPEMVKKAEPAHLAKRDTVFTTTTVTEGGDDSVTTTEVNTRTVVTVDVVDSTSTETVTETEQADASTTVTVTSTRTVTSQEGGVITSDEPLPTTSSGSDGSDGGNNGNDDGGLSTGAKAGIGAGAGVAGLVVIGALGWFCLKRRRSGPKPDPDDFLGASEVPVGAGAAGGVDRATSHHSQPTMSQGPSNPLNGGGGYIPPKRNSLHQNAMMEGYRGTALGDGRAGYAKPEPFGSAYAVPHNKLSPSPGTTNSYPTNRSSTLGADTLPEHSTPAEADSARGPSPPSATSPHAPPSAELGPGGYSARWQNPDAQEMDTSPANHHTGPVYEMAGQNYR